MALLQWWIRLRACDQGTAGGFFLADAVLGEVLGHRGGVEFGHADLQLKRLVPRVFGLAVEVDHPFVEVLALGDGGCLKISAWQDDDQTGRSDSENGLGGGGCGTKS